MQIYIDLEETLVHSLHQAHFLKFHDLVKDMNRCVIRDKITLLRPEAHSILKRCRNFASKVVLMTISSESSVQAINEGLNLNFRKQDIYAKDRFLLKEKSICPDAILIDNQSMKERALQLKLQTLGIHQERFLQIPSFANPSFYSASEFLQILESSLHDLMK